MGPEGIRFALVFFTCSLSQVQILCPRMPCEKKTILVYFVKEAERTGVKESEVELTKKCLSGTLHKNCAVNSAFDILSLRESK